LNGLPHVLAVGLILTQLTGCSLLDALLGFEEPFGPGGPFPTPTTEVHFTSGSATLTIDGETRVLDELAGDARIDGLLGLTVRWTDGAGWYLGIESFGDADDLEGGAYLSLDWIADNRHWTVWNSYECETTFERAGEFRVKGSATCEGLEWTDYLSNSTLSGPPEPVAGQAAFDVEMTFEAR
jgi:hypothetical protein